MIDSDHEGTFGSCTYADFKQHAAEFFRMPNTITTEQKEEGVKALGIFYLALSEDTPEHELHQARMLLQMAERSIMEFPGLKTSHQAYMN